MVESGINNRSRVKQELLERNAKIMEAYRDGVSMEELAERYYLSIHAIRNLAAWMDRMDFVFSCNSLSGMVFFLYRGTLL